MSSSTVRPNEAVTAVAWPAGRVLKVESRASTRARCPPITTNTASAVMYNMLANSGVSVSVPGLSTSASAMPLIWAITCPASCSPETMIITPSPRIMPISSSPAMMMA